MLSRMEELFAKVLHETLEFARQPNETLRKDLSHENLNSLNFYFPLSSVFPEFCNCILWSRD